MGPVNSNVSVNFPKNLNEIAASPAGSSVFKALSERVRARRTTDLNRLHEFILDNIDESVDEKSFLDVFRSLESIGAGKLIIGRKNRPNRFRWNYNLKEAAQAAMTNKSIAEVSALTPKPRGPKPKIRKTRKVKSKLVASTPIKQSSGLVINIQLPQNAKPEDVKAFLELAKELQ